MNLTDWRIDQQEWVLLPSDIAFAEFLDLEQAIENARIISAASARVLRNRIGRTAA